MNILTEIQNLINPEDKKVRIGRVMRANPDGGFVVRPLEGGEEVIFGNAVIGDTILYKEGQFIGRIKSERKRTVRIR